MFRILIIYLIIGCLYVLLVDKCIDVDEEENPTKTKYGNKARWYLLIMGILIWPVCIIATICVFANVIDAPDDDEEENIIKELNDVFGE